MHANVDQPDSDGSPSSSLAPDAAFALPSQGLRIAAAVGCVVLFALLIWGGMHIDASVHAIRQLPEDTALTEAANLLDQLRRIGMAAAGVVVFAGLMQWQAGKRIRKARRFPAPGQRVLRRTMIRVDANADAVASRTARIGWACIVAGSMAMVALATLPQWLNLAGE